MSKEQFKGMLQSFLIKVNRANLPLALDDYSAHLSDLFKAKDQRIAELEEQLANSIRPKFKPNTDLFVIVGYRDETKSIEQYYIDEIVIRGDGKLVEYRDVEQETIIGENNLLFATFEEAQAKLEELRGK